MNSTLVQSRRRALLTSACLLSSTRWPLAHATDRVVFGIVPYLPARRLIALYAPIVPTIEKVFNRPVDILCAQDYRQHIHMLRNREFDLVADSLITSRIAQKEAGYVPVLRTKAGLEPLIVIPKESAIRSIRDLQGQTISTTDKTASLAVTGLRYLRDQGLEPGKKVQILISGSHSNSLHLMLTGQATAALVSRTTLAQVSTDLTSRIKILDAPPPSLAAVVYHAKAAHKALIPDLQKSMMAFANNTEAGQNFIRALSHGGLVEITPSELTKLDPLVVEFYRQLAAS